MKFRKKPVVIEAFQLTTDNVTSTEEWPVWMQEVWSISPPVVYMDAIQNILLIETLEGTHRAIPGDWIIQGVNGELYPCKPDIFEKTYEPA